MRVMSDLEYRRAVLRLLIIIARKNRGLSDEEMIYLQKMENKFFPEEE